MKTESRKPDAEGHPRNSRRLQTSALDLRTFFSLRLRTSTFELRTFFSRLRPSTFELRTFFSRLRPSTFELRTFFSRRLRTSTFELRTFYVLLAALLVASLPSLLAHDPITTKVTWDREIGPLITARCVTCHSPGGPAPMPLVTYEQARPWARAIREEVLARRMPKWPIVRGYGDFSNDPSLSPFEIALIAAWVDGGAPPFAKATGGKPAFGKATGDKPPLPNASASSKPAGNPEGADGKRGLRLESSQALAAPVLRGFSGGGNKSASALKNVTIPCSSTTLPAGRLMALRPLLAEGASLRLSTLRPDGSEEPLLWLRDFDPAFAETYWLRNPLAAARGTRLIAAADTLSDTCSLTLLFE